MLIELPTTDKSGQSSTMVLQVIMTAIDIVTQRRPHKTVMWRVPVQSFLTSGWSRIRCFFARFRCQTASGSSATETASQMSISNPGKTGAEWQNCSSEMSGKNRPARVRIGISALWAPIRCVVMGIYDNAESELTWIVFYPGKMLVESIPRIRFLSSRIGCRCGSE